MYSLWILVFLMFVFYTAKSTNFNTFLDANRLLRSILFNCSWMSSVIFFPYCDAGKMCTSLRCRFNMMQITEETEMEIPYICTIIAYI